MASHILYDCEALVVLRFRHLGHHLLEMGNYTDISISKVQHHIQSAGLLSAQTNEFYSLGTYSVKQDRSVLTQEFIFQYIPFYLVENVTVR
jgi:hypothetical protein